MDKDDGELEILTYRAFCNRQALLAWRGRWRAHEEQHGAGFDGVNRSLESATQLPRRRVSRTEGRQDPHP